MPAEVTAAWENREGPAVFVTVNRDGVPNAIYATSISKFRDDTGITANNFSAKTIDNILAGSKASVLFLTRDRKSYQRE